MLRVFRPGYHQPDEMEGELIWIHRLVKDTDIKTADVLPDKEGKLLCQIQVEGSLFYCTLFVYIEGVTLRGLDGEELYYYMEKMGEIAAKLHLQIMSWPESGQLKRFRWDLDDLLGSKSRWGDYSLMRQLPDEYMQWYDQAAVIIRKRLERFGRSQDRYGLIHDDISINNVLVNGEDIYFLDFDDCGFGWFLYDIPTVVLEYFDETLEEGLAALLRGYERIRPLSEEEKQELPTFVLLKKIVRIGWIATRSDNDTVKGVKPDYYKKTAELAKKYCRESE